ncbi:MAG: hypothetical protein JRH19_07600 [Deltaproteobacteria bacterium]|nr:hypothetical protein [Deltaproteobacteria bacterium]
MQVEINDGERQLLLKIAEVALGELKAEVRRTATKDYHDELVVEESTLSGLIERLRSAA